MSDSTALQEILGGEEEAREFLDDIDQIEEKSEADEWQISLTVSRGQLPLIKDEVREMVPDD